MTDQSANVSTVPVTVDLRRVEVIAPNFKQRLSVGAGRYWQQGYAAGPIWSVRYDHAWELDRRLALRYGIGRLLQPYDGVGTGRTFFSLTLDSELIVRQLQGRYKVKNETLQTLFHEVQGLLAGFTRWTVGHVPRAKNARADELANRGIDEKKKR